MTGQDLHKARKVRGWTQQQAGEHLGVSQGYVSMLEGDRRHLPSHLVQDILDAYEISPLALPLHGAEAWTQLNDGGFATQLAGLGYPGFSYRNARATWSPAELLVVALTKYDLERRVAEALPWLALRYHDMNWDWVVREAKLRDAQNRLGFTVTLARELAEQKEDVVAAAKLLSTENQLQRSKLVHVGTFCNERMSQAEKHWLQDKSSPEAQRWNVLSDLAPEHLAHASTA